MEQNTRKYPELRMTPEVAAAAVADRCRQDREFMKNLCADPRAALIEASGKSVPDSMNVAVHHNSADHWHVVIPSATQAERLGEAFKMMDDADGTLSDEQLLAVSGGEIFITLFVVGATVVGVTAAAAVVTSAVVART